MSILDTDLPHAIKTLPCGRQWHVLSHTKSLFLNQYWLPIGRYFSEVLMEMKSFSFKKMREKISSAKYEPFCLGINMLTHWCIMICVACLHKHMGLYNGLGPVLHQAIIQTNHASPSTTPWRTNRLQWENTEINKFSLTKCHLELSSVIFPPLSLVKLWICCRFLVTSQPDTERGHTFNYLRPSDN